ncbi:rod shape-determining protein MreC [Halothiobacillus sp. DCM-1]|uniref:rod shape-determining protein MreC n=1 Tax=Halothiobacillus sp. DCM-1 TaxID=3112558 RepID=UPI00324B4C77
MALFETHRPGITKLLLLVLLSVLLMALDRAGNSMVQQVNTQLASITDGLARLVAAPINWSEQFLAHWQSQGAQAARITQLEQENLLLKGQMQQFFHLQTEVNQLKTLLHGQNTPVSGVLLATRIAQHNNPEQRSFNINRGSNDGVQPGQPVIDGYGIVGQIIRSSRTGAVVLQMDSHRQALSVKIGDTGFIGILNGSGTRNLLSLDRIPDRYPVKVGDILYTSGLDGVFPPGYPVARVTQIHNERSQAFLNITATPVAHLDHLQQVLVLTNPPDAPPPPSLGKPVEAAQTMPAPALIEAGQPNSPAPVLPTPPATSTAMPNKAPTNKEMGNQHAR